MMNSTFIHMRLNGTLMTVHVVRTLDVKRKHSVLCLSTSLSLKILATAVVYFGVFVLSLGDLHLQRHLSSQSP